MRQTLLISVFLFVVCACLAQTATGVVNGRVTDSETHKPLPYVTCKVLNADGKLLTYATTNTKGDYSVRIVAGAKQIVFSLIGYEEQSRDVSTIATRLDIDMNPTEFIIKEVTVTAKPIEITDDTIKYNVSAFKGKEDRYIEDVLKKMPGIEVKENGAIKYKGQDINQFNIEGQNLLGNRYNQATRNLSSDAVAQVQVIENDQPIRALKGIQSSDKATLNIKLKAGYKMRPFGEVAVGVGLGTDNHFLWDNRLTLINVNKKHQMLLNTRMNNSGTNLSYNTFEHLNIFDMDNYAPLPKEFITPSAFFYPPIKENRYLHNKSITTGLNHLCRLGEYGNVRTNITYYGNSETQNDSTSHVYNGDYTFSLFEANHRKARTHTLIPELRYEMNAPKTYLTNQLSAMFSFATNSNTLNSNAQNIQETTDRHPFYIQNKLNVSLRSGHRMYGINSIMRWFQRSETLNTNGQMTEFEEIRFRSFFTRNTLSTSFRLWRNAINLKYGMEYRNDRLSIDSLNNSTTTPCQTNNWLKNYVVASYSIKYERGSVGLDFPLNLLATHIPWKTEKRSSTAFYLSPSLSWRHTFSAFLNLNFRGSIDKSPSSDFVSDKHYQSNYRSRIFMQDNVGWTHSSSLAFSLNYANLINMITWNLTGTASWRTNDHYNAYKYGAQLTEIRPIWEDARSRVFYGSITVDKTFTKIDLQIRGAVNGSRNEMLIAQNDMRRMIKSNVLSANVFFSWDKYKWIAMSNDLTFNIAWQDRFEGNNSYALKSLYNMTSVQFYPFPKTAVGLSLEQNTLETDKGRYETNIFLDATVRYTVSKQLDFRLRMSNLLNRQEYMNVSFSGLNYTSFRMPLRGREVMLTASMRI